MHWYERYWDLVDQLYWNPSLLGLPSIPKSEWGDDPQHIKIERARVKNGGSIYARRGTSKENAIRMRCLEEPLNHIFDLTFSIAADAVIGELIFQPLGFGSVGPFERLGREVDERYGWAGANVTQQDGFFVSENSAVGVELKLGSKTWPLQTLKYLALMVAEQHLTGRKSELGLLYITPSQNPSTLWRDCGASEDATLPSTFLETCAAEKLNSVLRRLLNAHFEAFEDAASRVRLAHVSWRDFADASSSFAATLNDANVGEATLGRLLQGFSEAVKSHHGTCKALIR